jgi:hypothetical protein
VNLLVVMKKELETAGREWAWAAVAERLLWVVLSVLG